MRPCKPFEFASSAARKFSRSKKHSPPSPQRARHSSAWGQPASIPSTRTSVLGLAPVPLTPGWDAAGTVESVGPGRHTLQTRRTRPLLPRPHRHLRHPRPRPCRHTTPTPPRPHLLRVRRADLNRLLRRPPPRQRPRWRHGAGTRRLRRCRLGGAAVFKDAGVRIIATARSLAGLELLLTNGAPCV